MDRRTLAPTNRLTRVVYRISPDSSALSRTQEYLDDPAGPQRWSELVAADVARLEISPLSGDAEAVAEPLLGGAFASRRIGDVQVAAVVPEATGVASRARLRITSQTCPVDQEIWTH
jgi:hypothetical protein